MKKIEAIIKPFKLEEVKDALAESHISAAALPVACKNARRDFRAGL